MLPIHRQLGKLDCYRGPWINISPTLFHLTAQLYRGIFQALTAFESILSQFEYERNCIAFALLLIKITIDKVISLKINPYY